MVFQHAGAGTGAFLDYWGKARPATEAGPRFHRLAYHCLDVAAVGAELLRLHRPMRERLLAASGLKEHSLDAFLPFALALHDLGKFAATFQGLRPEVARELGRSATTRGYSTRHDAMGVALWSGALVKQAAAKSWLRGRLGPDALAGRDLECLVEPWMRAVLGHHGQPAVDPGGLDLHFPVKDPSRSDALAFVEVVSSLLGPVSLEFDRAISIDDVEAALKPSSWLAAGVAVLCDWVGSNTEWFPYCAEPMPLEAYWAKALPLARKGLEKCGVLPCEPRHFGGLDSLFPEIDLPRPMQRAAQEVELASGPQLFILEDLTGSGKTEAAVVLAHRLMAEGAGGGVFFALPTMATANAMFGRIEGVVAKLFAEGERPSVVLAHSAPHLVELRDLELPSQPCDDDYAGSDAAVSTQCSAWIRDSRKRSLLAHVGVGTLDQALMAVMQVRHGTLRLLGVTRNVLVVDEVHAYDAYMTEHLERLLQFQAGLGGSAILLSATLPQRQRARLVAAFQKGAGTPRQPVNSTAYPLLTHASPRGVLEREVPAVAGSRRQVKIAFLDTPEAAADLATRAVEAGRAVCWIRNTVQDALDAHALLRGRVSAEALRLFHARFAMGDRLRIEQDVVRAFGKAGDGQVRAGSALVATQVVEQSLDLDFDELITDLAPMDLVIQRAGRLHRRARAGRGEPVLHVLAPSFTEAPKGSWFSGAFPRAAYVYPDWGQLWLTERELLRRGVLDLPQDARALMEAVFSDAAREQIPSALQRASDEAEQARKVSASIAQGAGVVLETGYGGDDRAWETDARVATRLGEPTTLVRLARVVGGKAVAWFEHGRFPWELSQLQVARRRIAFAGDDDQALIAQAEGDMPFVDEGMVTVVLREGATGFVGKARDVENRPVQVLYDGELGLRVEKES
ncbi:MAG: CRISPR-associated helicase Cas3' [Deltaproteobacteria bacterium]|nr:CRISPR-associated helicase Cas3' [Deltaproteobacteria bacterium]